MWAGSSRPSLARSAASDSGVAIWPRMMLATSPGRMLVPMKISTETTNRVMQCRAQCGAASRSAVPFYGRSGTGRHATTGRRLSESTVRAARSARACIIRAGALPDSTLPSRRTLSIRRRRVPRMERSGIPWILLLAPSTSLTWAGNHHAAPVVNQGLHFAQHGMTLGLVGLGQLRRAAVRPMRSLCQKVSFQLRMGANWIASLGIGRRDACSRTRRSSAPSSTPRPSSRRTAPCLMVRSKPIFFRLACISRQISSMPRRTGATMELGGGHTRLVQVELRLVRVELANGQVRLQ